MNKSAHQFYVINIIPFYDINDKIDILIHNIMHIYINLHTYKKYKTIMYSKYITSL